MFMKAPKERGDPRQRSQDQADADGQLTQRDCPRKPALVMTIRKLMKSRYQSYVIAGRAGASGIAAARCQ